MTTKQKQKAGSFEHRFAFWSDLFQRLSRDILKAKEPSDEQLKRLEQVDRRLSELEKERAGCLNPDDDDAEAMKRLRKLTVKG